VNSIYLIGSLRNDKIPEIAKAFREGGIEVFDDWYAAGPEADDYWKSYETSRGRTYKEALEGYAAGHVFDFDFHHLNRVDGGVLVLPAGKSAHIEFGYLRGLGKPAYVLFPGEPAEDRWDVMYRFRCRQAPHQTPGVGHRVQCLGRRIEPPTWTIQWIRSALMYTELKEKLLRDEYLDDFELIRLAESAHTDAMVPLWAQKVLSSLAARLENDYLEAREYE
jgi:hypothetical protein